MKKLLVADDSSTIQKVIKIAFSKYAVKVIEASTFVEALRSAAVDKPDAIIADANLVGAQGPLDLKKIQENAGGSPILVLVGSYESVDQSQLRKHGLQHILQKPFDTRDIINKVVNELKITLEVTPQRSDMVPPPLSRGITEFSDSLEDASPELLASIAEAGPIVSGDPFETLRRAVSSLDSQLPFLDSAVKGTRAFGGQPESAPAPASRSVAPVANQRTESTKFSPPVERASAEFPPVWTPESNIQQDIAEKAKGKAPINRDELSQLMTPLLRDELNSMVKDAVNAYCDGHFNDLAREIILQELRRLAEEKSKHLTDH
jgi:CheY-like chemotaxis protein